MQCLIWSIAPTCLLIRHHIYRTLLSPCSSEDDRDPNAAANGADGLGHLSEKDAAKAARRAAAMEKFNNQIRQLDQAVGGGCTESYKTDHSRIASSCFKQHL